MSYRKSFLLLFGLAAVAVPIGLVACGHFNPAADERTDGKPDSGKEPPPKDGSAKERVTTTTDEKKLPALVQGEFKLPDDIGGKLVSRMVEPTQRRLDRDPVKPRFAKPPRGIDNPSAPLPAQVASIPRLPDSGPKRPYLPELISPEPIFGMEEAIGSLPHALSFPAQERVRIESADVGQPVTMPLQAQPLPDKITVADPTLDVSKSAALSAALPERQTPAPFQRFTLPDPFENHETIKLNVPAGEETLPEGSVRLPKK